MEPDEQSRSPRIDDSPTLPVEPRPSASAPATEHQLSFAPGDRIGPYLIVRVLGSGGMGSVYLALRSDDTFRKQVALKVVKGGMDTEFVLSRFRHERQILAGLEHPNIARLLDGGATAQGLPYFAMEYVEGVPITLYCKLHRLDVRARIELVRTVCSAVTAAHQNLVVHRDIKPANILVTEAGVPKLLDFGIAKMLNESVAGFTLTAPDLRLFTPVYASPEQILGEPITTACDVYALGVLLYELLAGKPPYQLKNHSPGELERIICHTEPAPPSTVASAGLDADLDNIILMAMRKEPGRRYASASQLSEDLERYLDGRPVVARKDTLVYRARKFVRRNRVAAVAAAVVAATLVGGIIATTHQARVASRRFEQLRHLSNVFLFEFHGAIENVPGATKARELVVKRGLEYLDGLAAEARGDPALQLELATAYQKMGDVQGHPVSSSLGDSAGALHSYQRALAILETLDPSPPVRERAADLLSNLGTLQRNMGQTRQGLESYRRALAYLEPLQAAPAAKTLPLLLGINDNISRTLTTLGNLRGALESSERSLALLEKPGAAADAATNTELAASHATLSILLARLNRPREALEHARAALAIRERRLAAKPGDMQEQRQVMIAWSHIGDNLGSPSRANLGDYRGAVDAYHQCRRIAETLAAQDPLNTRVQIDLSYALMRIGSSLGAAGNTGEATAQLRRAIAMQRRILAADPRNLLLARNLAFALRRLGEIEQFGAASPAAALGHYHESLAVLDDAQRKDPANTDGKQQRILSQLRLAVLEARMGRAEVAAKAVEGAPDLAASLASADPEDVTRAAQPAVAASLLAQMHAAAGKKEEAARLAAEGTRLFEDLGRRFGSVDAFRAWVAPDTPPAKPRP